MVFLRATQRLLAGLPTPTPTRAASDTALGDWYVKPLVVDRQPLLLLVSSASLLSIVTPARDVRRLPDRLPTLVAGRLRRLGVAEAQVDAEVAAMHPVLVGRTEDRSVLGSLVDFGKAVPIYLSMHGQHAAALSYVEARLAETPCRVTGPERAVIFPGRAARDLLAARW